MNTLRMFAAAAAVVATAGAAMAEDPVLRIATQLTGTVNWD